MASTSKSQSKRKNEVMSASTSTSRSKRKNELMSAFDGIAPIASTSTSKRMKKPSYDVFINHRGPDVKSTLASTLYGILTGMELSVFLDSQELEYGDFLPRTIEAAMSSALLHIAIFSQRYAESPWCLTELSFMLKTGATIIPVFYHVDPSDLRWIDQGKGLYVKAFDDHKQKGRYSPEKLQEWKDALFNVSFYSGEIIRNNDDEMRLLKKIVNIVLKEIKNQPLMVAKHPVGLEEIVKDFEVNTLQSVESDQGVQIVGIWGMGGSGKTTLAKELYNRKSSLIKRSSFVFDVREAATKGFLHEKQKKILKDLGVQEAFDNIEEGMQTLSRYLRSIKVLIVVDDVDRVDQLDALLSAKDSLERGSLIIVTTREYDVLKCSGITSIYKMKALDPSHGKKLFCWHAFIQPFPRDGFEKLVKEFLEACCGLPLSLKVFGAQLYGEFCKECWEHLLHKIRRVLPNDIKEKLKVSYDALDDEEKEAFLDTACFFIGERNSLAIEVWNGFEVWNGSGWFGLYSWERLLNKCLVELDNDNRIMMHDHLRDLGREIAKQHSPYRFWLSQQIIDADKHIEKGNSIRGIKTIPTGIRQWTYSCEVEGVMLRIDGGILSLTQYLGGLKIFVTRGECFNQVIGEVSEEIVWLRWFQIGQRNIPAWFSMKYLRVLELYEGYEGEHHLKELWKVENMAPVQLRELHIFNCHNFQRFPNSIGCLKGLRKIVVGGRNSIKSLPEEFCHLQSLEHLELMFSNMLESLPRNFGDLTNLRHLNLYGCDKLRMLSVSFKKLMLLQYLNLQGCKKLIIKLDDFQNIKMLKFFRLSWCDQLKELPRHITNQASLRELYLNGLKLLRELPINVGQLSKLQKLTIGSELLTSVPESYGDLSYLTTLHISNCHKLECLPTSLGNLFSLIDLQISGCFELKYLPISFGNLSVLTNFKISECHKLKCLPTSLGNLSALTNLDISHCFELKCLPTSLGNLFALTNLQISGCQKLKCLPTSFENLSSLNKFEIIQFPKLKFLPTSLGNISSLTNLQISECPQLKYLPISLTNLSALTNLRINVCNKLKCLPASFENLSALTKLEISECPQLKYLPTSLANLSALTNLRIDKCNKLKGLPVSLENLSALTNLQISECPKVKFLPFSVGYLNCLEYLKISHCQISQLDFGAISEDRYTCLQSLHLLCNNHLKEIALPRTVQNIFFRDCEMLRNIRVFGHLVNLVWLDIKSCPELEELPNFTHSTSLRYFKLSHCHRV